MNPKILIIILNWNGKKDTLECLESSTKIDYDNYEIVVVDNGSTDDSVKSIREKYSHIKIIENNANLGYAEGNNVGIRYALSENTDYILLLNNDTIVDKNLLTNFIKASENYPKAGIFGAKIYYFDTPNKIWFAGGTWQLEKAKSEHIGGNEIDDSGFWNDVKEVDYACGCALLIKSEVIQKIGLLESRFFLTWEELDWCYRAKKLGYQSLIVPSAKVWHKISASFVGGAGKFHQQYFMERNRLLWMEKHLQLNQIISVYKRIILPEIYESMRGYLSSNSSPNKKAKCKVSLAAFRDYIQRRFGDCPSWVRSIKE
ncbi:glycosyltransferase family 2 protein [Aphanothece sacrum]|uniref:Glycosyl transferase n=1 Tax=Aphanothece sacrum FPU1 TaxID=1920663 RepID=A0A401II06_APHSA|nr:glycosyltransferase family 2 protein [Aphanothece sacrum]GBF80945.1 glycosyl transferase [Aphanothece sacrum FPU1]GBF85252.1 glycosyl transferase [Aphanothece sacrum FPU3]